MKKDCAYTRKSLRKYLHGHLFKPEQIRVERHLRSCVMCYTEYQALEQAAEANQSDAGRLKLEDDEQEADLRMPQGRAQPLEGEPPAVGTHGPFGPALRRPGLREGEGRQDERGQGEARGEEAGGAVPEVLVGDCATLAVRGEVPAAGGGVGGAFQGWGAVDGTCAGFASGGGQWPLTLMSAGQLRRSENWQPKRTVRLRSDRSDRA